MSVLTAQVRVCADCLYFVRIRRRWLSSLVACCDRPEARHIVTGEPDTCYHMRNCGACAEEGKLYEERPGSPGPTKEIKEHEMPSADPFLEALDRHIMKLDYE